MSKEKLIVYADTLDKTHKGKQFMVGNIYLHAKLEYENGYDICGMETYPEYPGIYDCIVKSADGKTWDDCILYYWIVYEHVCGNIKHEMERKRGLVCLKDDKFGNDNALEKFNGKVVRL